MVLFICGTPGLGKTSVASKVASRYPEAIHIEIDKLRRDTKRSNPGNRLIEDAINWRAFCLATDHSLSTGHPLAIIDSTGASNRLAYLRQALSYLPQAVIRLYSSFPLVAAQTKWGNLFSAEVIDFFHKKVMSLQADHDICVDGKTPDQIAQEILVLLGS